MRSSTGQRGVPDVAPYARVRSPWPIIALLAFGLALARAAPASQPDAAPLDDIARLVDEGRFEAATARIDASLASTELPDEARRAFEFERERMRRIRLDFPHDRADVAEQLRRHAPDLTASEIDAWDEAGWLEHQVIDGKRCYFDRAAANAFRVSPAALARRDPKLGPFREGPYERLNAQHAAIRDAARASRANSVEPRRLRITQSLTVEPDAVPAGETVRAWIPYPRAIAGQQEGIRYVASAPPSHRIAPETALQRTVYLEQSARAGEPTKFSVTYDVTIHARYHAIDAARVESPKTTQDLAPFLAERPPHIVFTPTLRAFSRRAVGEAKQPYEIAKRLFDAVDRIPWAGAREYSTLTNIPEHIVGKGYGDCGQQTLLLMTLLRMNGIPSRWQSGWVFSDGDYSNLHDWGALYLAPYGWVPMDVTTGRLESDDPALAYFYLGGLDAYRIAFNDDWGRDFVPPKKHFRSDTVDSQRGEVEWDGGNLYFDQWDYEFDWQMLPIPKPAASIATNPTNSISGEGA